MNERTIMSTGWSPARLLMREGSLAGQKFTLSQGEAVLGRDTAVEISIQDPEMSRRHARVTWQQGEYVLEDLGSTNGTTVNGVQIREPHTLQNGDTIGVGQSVLEFVWQAESPAPAPEPAAYGPVEAEPATFQAPPAQPAPQSPAAPAKKKNNCLLYGCGCLVLLALLLAIALVLVVLLIPEQIQPLLDENNIPIQLVQLLTFSGSPLV